ncbi:G2/mitotic-specific cyclin-A-like [Portunus trituberculatus]|nr:G2/mitotic-specific cyclin-A-like [Portunus trituberculatus]
MSSMHIDEDQENRVPAHRRLKRDAATSGARPSAFGLQGNTNRRPVLCPIGSSNVRKQPVRAAKQGVSYETGVPQQQNDENAGAIQKTLSTSSLQSFTIHQDSSSVPSSTSISGSQAATCSTTTLSTSSSSNKTSLSHSTSLPAVRHPLRERKVKPAQDESLEIIDLDPSIISLHRSSDSSEASGGGEVMDMSVCEDDILVPDSSPKEDLLHARADDVFDVPEYASDIYHYSRQAEVFHKPRANYMSKQMDITANMRWILVDWLVEVAEEYTLHAETLYLAVSYIDRFLSHMSVKRDKLQLVGTTAMFIAAKFEEIYPPDVSQFAYITDNTYKVGQILRMEHLILKVLSFDMAVPTAHFFVNKFSRLLKSPEEVLHLALFLAEMSMLDCDPFLRYLPSLIAASAVALANHTQGRVAWPQHMVEWTGYTLEDLRECYVNLYRAFSRVQEPQQHAIRDKYKSNKWHGVSQLTPRSTFPW